MLRVYVAGLTAVFLLLAALISVPAALYSIVYMRNYEGYSVARYYPYFLWLVPPAGQADYPLAKWGLVVALLGTITLFTGTMQALKLKRLVRPDGWPDGVHPLRKDVPWNQVPEGFDEDREFQFDDPPEGCTVVPFGPFHPTLDEPAHFRLYVEGEMVRGCEYRGFMVHRGIEKLAESVLTYNDIPMMAERIGGICGCVHNVAYAQAVETAVALRAPPRAEYIRTIMLEIERLHSHLLWVGLACHIVGSDTLFMQSWRIREPIMWIAEKISGNRKTYALCVIGGVRWDITPEVKAELRQVLDKLEAEWRAVVAAVSKDKNIQKRTRGVGVADPTLVKNIGLIGPVARAAGADIDCRRDHPYAA